MYVITFSINVNWFRIVICSAHRQNALLGKNSSESDFVTLFMKAVQGMVKKIHGLVVCYSTPHD